MGPCATSIAVAVCSRVVFLALCAVLTKSQFGTFSVGLSGESEAFSRPVFMNLTAQLALLLAGCLGTAARELSARRSGEAEAADSLMCMEEGGEPQAPAKALSTGSEASWGSTHPPSDTELETRGQATSHSSGSAVDVEMLPEVQHDEVEAVSPSKVQRAEPQAAYPSAVQRDEPEAVSSSEVVSMGKVLRIGVVSAMAMAGGVIGSVALLFLPTSVWQLSQASGILFTAVLARLCLGQRLTLIRRLGVSICITGVALASLSDVLDVQTSLRNAVTGMALALLSQALGAATAVAEEHLLKSAAVPPLQLIAWEGAWGVALTLIAVYPVMRLLPGNQGHLVDDLVMLTNSPELLAVQGSLLLAMMAAGVSGIAVTALLSSVHRKMLNISVGAIVWAAALVVYYCIDARASFGEAWKEDSLVELAGFLLIAVGQATYGGLLRCRRLSAMAEKPAQESSATAPPSAREAAACSEVGWRNSAGVVRVVATGADSV